jgi:hypothetical protein
MRCIYGKRRLGPTTIPGHIMTPGNDNPGTPRQGFDVMGAIIILAFIAMLGGLFLAWLIGEWWPVIISILALIFFMAG